jgi:hypothetical protein
MTQCRHMEHRAITGDENSAQLRRAGAQTKWYTVQDITTTRLCRVTS